MVKISSLFFLWGDKFILGILDVWGNGFVVE